MTGGSHDVLAQATAPLRATATTRPASAISSPMRRVERNQSHCGARNSTRQWVTGRDSASDYVSSRGSGGGEGWQGVKGDAESGVITPGGTLRQHQIKQLPPTYPTGAKSQ
ncbi:hypothetical protein J6590_012225 [Homalodisca vitripennis]|nr:hypothetical protein J6590_012225 [Homalodisca vitripennis]